MLTRKVQLLYDNKENKEWWRGDDEEVNVECTTERQTN